MPLLPCEAMVLLCTRPGGTKQCPARIAAADCVPAGDERGSFNWEWLLVGCV